MKTHVSLLKTILFLTLVLVGCQGSSDKETPPVELPQELFRDGDIAFAGNADSSACICAASHCRSAVKKGRTHIQCTDFPVLQCECPNSAAAF